MNTKTISAFLIAALSTTIFGATTASDWPARFTAPYVDATAWPPFDLVGTSKSTGLRHYVLAFVVAKSATSCVPSWGTYYDIGGAPDDFLKPKIDSLRSLGGDVMVSFGGAANTELAMSTTNIDTLEAAYRKVIESYGLRMVDFDIEGAAVADMPSIERRSKALASLQRHLSAAGHAVKIWYTLSVLPSGLDANGLAVVKSALENDVELSGVNIMAMDYGSWAAPHPSDSMGQYAIMAAKNVFAQLESAYATANMPRTEASLWSMIGITPMIGVNDDATEIFRLSDARELADFARSKGAGMLGFWSANRDIPCPNGPSAWASSSCSSIAQDSFAFSKSFQAFESNETGNVAPGRIRTDAIRLSGHFLTGFRKGEFVRIDEIDALGKVRRGLWSGKASDESFMLPDERSPRARFLRVERAGSREFFAAP